MIRVSSTAHGGAAWLVPKSSPIEPSQEIKRRRPMKLELYHFETCPYCRKVRNFIKENGLESKVVYYDTEKDSAAHTRLMALNSDEQVPCLVVDGKPMLESDEIIAWLKEHVVGR
jgi:glutaredoxin